MKPLASERKTVDKLDKKLVKIFVKRMDAVRRIGKLKKEAGLPVYDGTREAELLEKVTREGGAYAGAVAELYATVLSISKKSQEDNE